MLDAAPRITNQRVKRFLAILLLAAAAAPATRAQLFDYTFNDVVSGSSASAGGTAGGAVTFSSFTASGVGAASNAGGVFSFTGWTTGATNGSSTFSGGVDVTDYFQFTVTPGTGYTFSLSSLTFSAGRSSTGPRQFVIRSSADGFTANLGGSVTDPNLTLLGTNVFQFTDNTSTATYANNTITLGGAFTSLGSPLTFRIYGFNAEGGSGAFRIDDVSINGSLTAVPEPAAYATLLGAMALARAAWRRKSTTPTLAVKEK